MAHRTYFQLSILDTKKRETRKIIKAFRKSNADAEYAFDENGNSKDSETWYTSDEDLQEFSKSYPDKVFLLEGEPENGDIWKLYVKNNKKQYCEAIITFDEYDETKLV